MTTSMSYRRYLRIANPIETGISTNEVDEAAWNTWIQPGVLAAPQPAVAEAITYRAATSDAAEVNHFL